MRTWAARKAAKRRAANDDRPATDRGGDDPSDAGSHPRRHLGSHCADRHQDNRHREPHEGGLDLVVGLARAFLASAPDDSGGAGTPPARSDRQLPHDWPEHAPPGSQLTKRRTHAPDAHLRHNGVHVDRGSDYDGEPGGHAPSRRGGPGLRGLGQQGCAWCSTALTDAGCSTCGVEWMIPGAEDDRHGPLDRSPRSSDNAGHDGSPDSLPAASASLFVGIDASVGGQRHRWADLDASTDWEPAAAPAVAAAAPAARYRRPRRRDPRELRAAECGYGPL